VCGRFNLTAPGEELAEAFDLEQVPILKPRFNIAPSQPIAAIGFQPATGRRGLAELAWGPASRPRPWLFRMRSGRLFAFAGLWQPATAPGGTPTCAILTTEPNDLAREVHDRMPAIVDPADYGTWLDPGVTDARRLQPLLLPYPAAAMTAFPVNAAVNSPAVDDPSCVEPA
jgi:putative SOS response-associated peptidase YedK